MAKEYVEKRDGGYYIAGTRVSLDSIVFERSDLEIDGLACLFLSH